MNTLLQYMPVCRLRMVEKAVLTSRDFGDHIYPCVEIIKEREREPPEGRVGKSFEQSYIPTLIAIQSRKVFVDLPTYLKIPRNTNAAVSTFITQVVRNRQARTEHLLKLRRLADLVIPVITSFYPITNERESIVSQERDLRPAFPVVAFRVFHDSILNDLAQIRRIARECDFLIVDIKENIADPADDVIIGPVLDALEDFNMCPKILLRDTVCENIKNTGLDHCAEITEIENSLIRTYHEMGFQAFGDYAGIKKTDVTEGGTISPGFIYFDPVINSYFGFKGPRYQDARGKSFGKLGDFQDVIVPAVLASSSVRGMLASTLPFLSNDNWGWTTLNKVGSGFDNGKSQAKFKQISMDHYIHCIKTLIDAGRLPLPLTH